MKLTPQNKKTATEIADQAARLIVDPPHAIAHRRVEDVKQWPAWHAMLYIYERVYEASWICSIMIAPAKGWVWTANGYFDFVASMRGAADDLFYEAVPDRGGRYMVRPGKPRTAVLRRIWITSGS